MLWTTTILQAERNKVMKSRKMLHFTLIGIAFFVCISPTTWAEPFSVTVDISSLTGSDIELEFSLFNKNNVLGDSYVLVDNVFIRDSSGAILGPGLLDFEDKTLQSFDATWNPDSVSNVEGTFPGDSGSRQLRIDEDPVFFPTITFSFFDFAGSNATQLRFDFEFIVSEGTSDIFVASLLEPTTLEPFPTIPDLSGFGDFLEAGSTGNLLADGVTATQIFGLLGDVSGDNNINAHDALLVLQHIVGLITLSPDAQKAADVTGDKTISAFDAALILQHIVGLIAKFPAQKPKIAPALNTKSEIQLLTEVISELETISLSKEQRIVLEQLKLLVFQKVLPSHTALLPNYPNPFNPETWLPYKLAKAARVVIRIYNIKGELIRAINLGTKPAGIYTSKNKAAHWNGRTQTGETAASGPYFYTIQAGPVSNGTGAGNFTATRKMILMK